MRKFIVWTVGVTLLSVTFAGDLPADAKGETTGIVRDIRVVDLLGEKYAVSDYAGVDTGAFNCDAYKTGKLALVKIPAGVAYPVKPGKYREPLDDTDVMTVRRDYWIGLFEVTEAQYVQVMGNAPTNSTAAQGEVTYTDVRGTEDPTLEMTDEGVGDCFLRRLCEKCVDKDGNPVVGFDLPTEIQWEIACRAGTKSVYFWGDSLDDFKDYAWCSENTDDKNRSQSVGLKKPNAWGLYDTCGNVYELCRDTSGKDSQLTAEDPASGDDREFPSWAVRGGTYLINASAACLESSRRGVGRSAMIAQSDSGFRVVCTARYPFDATGDATGVTNDVMVVDLSAEPEAARYPVSRLRAVDIGRFDCDAYRTNKLALVCVSNGLWIGVRPVTRGQYARVMGGSAANPLDWQGEVSYETLRGTALGAQWPAIRATDLGSFFATLGVKAWLGFDLPSEAEWTAGRDAGMTMPGEEWNEWLLGPMKSGEDAANVGFRVALNETNAAIVVDGVWQVLDEAKVGEREYENRGLFKFSKLSEALGKINALPPGDLKTLTPSPTLYANRPVTAAKGASFGYDCVFVISNSNTIVDFSTDGNGCLALSGAMPGDDCQIRIANGAKNVEIRNIEFGEFDDVEGEWKSVPACPSAVVAEPGGEVELAYCQVTHGQAVRAFGKSADREGTLLKLYHSTLVSTNGVNPCVVSVSNATLIVNRSTVAAPYDLADKSRQSDGVRAIDARDALVGVENSSTVVGGARTADGGSGTGIWLEGGTLSLLSVTIGDRKLEDLLGWNGIHVERGTLNVEELMDVYVGVGNCALSFGDGVRAKDVRLADGMFFGGHAVDPDSTARGFLDVGDAAARFGRVRDQANDIKRIYCASNVVPFCHYNFTEPDLTPNENGYRPYGVVALADDDRMLANAEPWEVAQDGRTLIVQCTTNDFATGVGPLDLSVLAPEGVDGWNFRDVVCIANGSDGSVTTNAIETATALTGPAKEDAAFGDQPNGFCRVTVPWRPSADAGELMACASNGIALVRELAVFWDGKAPGKGGRVNIYRVRFVPANIKPVDPVPPEAANVPGGTVTCPRAPKVNGVVQEFLNGKSSATWKAKAAVGSVFGGWIAGTNAAETVSNLLAAAGEKVFKTSITLKIPAGAQVRPTDVVATWKRIDEVADISKGEVAVTLVSDPTMGTVTGCKIYKLGSKGTAKAAIGAKPAKGFVFAGWYENADFVTPAAFLKNGKPNDYRLAKQSLTVSSNVCYFARFVGKAVYDKVAGIWSGTDAVADFSFAGWDGEPIAADATDRWYQGVSVPTNVGVGFLSRSAVSSVGASGLPAGVKFDKTACRFTGAPTSASTAKKSVFMVTVTVKNASGAQKFVRRIAVEPLPAWAIGKFDGDFVDADVPSGTFTATVGKTGKFSGKIKVGRDTATLSAKSFSGVEVADEARSYFIEPTIKYRDPATRKTVTTLGSLVLTEIGIFGEEDAGRCVRASKR